MIILFSLLYKFLPIKKFIVLAFPDQYKRKYVVFHIWEMICNHFNHPHVRKKQPLLSLLIWQWPLILKSMCQSTKTTRNSHNRICEGRKKRARHKHEVSWSQSLITQDSEQAEKQTKMCKLVYMFALKKKFSHVSRVNQDISWKATHCN